MQSRWNDQEAAQFEQDPVQMRVYTSRLLGQDPALVLHGGGNTSVKAPASNRYGEREDILYVKGSGWDLGTIEAEGFSPVRMDRLLALAAMDDLTDSDIVRAQREALTNPYAPNPSVEAILHALIPYTYVDHTHADSVVAITNTPDGWARIEAIYGENMLIVPYVMPGFTLAKKVYEMTQGIDWDSLDGMILMNHGVFTFHDEARVAYEKMIDIVGKAEDYLAEMNALEAPVIGSSTPDLLKLSALRKAVAAQAGSAVIARADFGEAAAKFASRDDVAEIATRGPLTPDHVIRTKRTAVVIEDDPDAAVEAFAEAYQAYFERNTDGDLTMLAPAPRWAVIKGQGTVALGDSLKAADIVADITRHTIRAIQWAEALDAWQALPESAIFEVEYWELEQAKLNKGGTKPPLQGKVALVSGAASGIGRACAIALEKQGACVLGLDIDPSVESQFTGKALIGRACDMTDDAAVQVAVELAVATYGGLDIVISNAGVFPPSTRIEDMTTDLWERSMAVNLNSHQRLIQACLPYLKQGIDPAIVIVGSKNVPAPGPGQSAYSVAKAGLTQLARVAALELGEYGIRVNVVHPNAVFDTGAWSDETITARARHYGVTVEEYMRGNVLGVEITSQDVADLVAAMAGPLFSKVTGAQIPIDGGNDRVI